MEEGKEVKEENQDKKNFYEVENTKEGDNGEKLKAGKRNSFRLNYITHMIRR